MPTCTPDVVNAIHVSGRGILDAEYAPEGFVWGRVRGRASELVGICPGPNDEREEKANRRLGQAVEKELRTLLDGDEWRHERHDEVKGVLLV